MPSVVVTPALMRWTGQSVLTVPIRLEVTAASLDWTGGFLLAGLGTGGGTDIARPKLDRLTRSERITNPDGTVSVRFQTIWQRTMEAIENAFDELATRQEGDSALLAEIRAAQQLAQSANDIASTSFKQSSLETSYTDPLQTLSASSSGTIGISAHQRVYGDGTRVSVNAGSVSGFNQGDYVTVFYVDAARSGGAVTYQASTGTVSQTGTTHIVGQVAIPQAGEPDAGGTGPAPPGYTPQDRFTPRLPEE